MHGIIQRNRNVGLLAMLIGVVLTAGCGDAASDGPDARDGAVVSEQGLYEAHITPDPAEPQTGDNELTIHLMDRDGADVEGADLGVEPWMPAHGHGSPETPVVEELGGGTYVVTNVVYSMPGHWEIRIEIKNGDVSDRMVVDYDVE